MNLVNVILLFKIIVTLVVLAGPFLLLPQARLEELSGVTVKSDALFRLYGLGMLALAVAYATGIWWASHGVFSLGDFCDRRAFQLRRCTDNPSPRTT